LAGCSPGRGIEAITILRDIEAGNGPSRLKATTPAPTRTSIVFVSDSGPREADIYAPGDTIRASIVLVPGLTPRGRNDPRLVAFAETLARAGFEVIVPDLPRMRALRVAAQDAEPIADAARYLDERGGGRPLGVVAVSFAVGPAIIALQEPAAHERIDFFVGIGGYYDLEALITYITTGFYRNAEDQPWRYRPPKAYGKWVFLVSNADRLADSKDQATLVEMARRKLDDPNAGIDDLVTALGPEGEHVFALISNADPERVPALIEALPPEVRDGIKDLDLRRRNLQSLAVDFVLIHDRDDRTIPAGESKSLARALSPARVDLFIVGGLDHAQVKSPGIADTWALVEAVYRLLELRDH
jgi:pimeloyl-ACP methyl ester carboxylesterase